MLGGIKCERQGGSRPGHGTRHAGGRPAGLLLPATKRTPPPRSPPSSASPQRSVSKAKRVGSGMPLSTPHAALLLPRGLASPAPRLVLRALAPSPPLGFAPAARGLVASPLRAAVRAEQRGEVGTEVGDQGISGRPLRVGLVCGGPSAERGISLNSARSVLDHIQVPSIRFLSSSSLFTLRGAPFRIPSFLSSPTTTY